MTVIYLRLTYCKLCNYSIAILCSPLGCNTLLLYPRKKHCAYDLRIQDHLRVYRFVLGQLAVTQI